jgi:hypothetical protein
MKPHAAPLHKKIQLEPLVGPLSVAPSLTFKANASMKADL